jgi:hypothetical protein
MTWWIWTIVIVLGSSVLTEVCFILCLTCDRMRKAGVWMPWELKLVARYVLFPIGALGDVVMSQTRGRIEFGELQSRGLMMTHRIQWHVDHSTGKHLRRALRWTALANWIDPDHIEIPADVEQRLAA